MATDVCGDVGLVDIYLFRTGISGPQEPIAYGLPYAGTYSWVATGPMTQRPQAFMRVVARDPAGNSG